MMEKALKFLKGKTPTHFKDTTYAKLEIGEWMVEFHKEQSLIDGLNKTAIETQMCEGWKSTWEEEESKRFWLRKLNKK